MKIGVFDSGKGGLTVITEIKKLLPNEEYKFIPDFLNCPYGDKSTKELREITSEITERLINWGAEIIVIACNTATVKCIDYLREKYPEVEFVGTEPAVKVAAETNAKNIMVLATPGTIRSERLEKTIAETKRKDQVFTLVACKGLAETIEKNLSFSDDGHALISNLGVADFCETFEENLKAAHIPKNQPDPEIIVLGCTHYPLIDTLFKLYFKNAKYIDGNLGVARRVKALVEQKSNKKSTA